ncbi:PTS sugar transporter subunit IIC [Bacillus toyonensis]|uniref:PTS sugar transporter subunit IIC n=1 Tax=Bacillus toyonensis TaxID=155322 RepID=UPI000B44260F|nr:PTS transporter subunit EIIC [Bacillus toyonensis]OTX29169.1 PTS sugar transporter subunit IIC [Bacillus thuringiensis serovar malayensis]OUB06911.1 PTS sugar transporter subunit IIC [Bacillus thuringiensis serovar shandongiensis]MBX0350789.1 PTS transporter subunit EIIC [Bacillus toyonensis]MDF9448751.1 PTS transporter subunit EIIC [Bacillus toyonensis]MDG1563610.1 PTS transporter subunit EIIC [Bacillus toyonensis]
MKLLEGTKNGLERIITPLTNYLGNSKVVNAITSGMMMTIPVTIGVTLFAILGNLPFEGWKEFLIQIGIYTHMQDMISATLSLLAVYMVVIIAYSYAKEEGMNGMTAAVIALGSFLCLMPMSIKVGEEQIPAILNQYLGSDGIFVAMFVGVFTSKLYCSLKRKNIGVKLPESVPPMVADAINPVFISIIIFTLIFFIRVIFGYTPYENIFNFVSQVIALPVKFIGSSVWSVIAIFTFMNICWFFGLHPAPIINVWYSATAPLFTAAITAFASGTPFSEIPYLAFTLMHFAVVIGGTGNTLGLAINLLFAKSEQYKSLGKIGIVPNIFNINEPIVFGLPLVLNPIYFIPLITSSIVGGLIGIVFLNITGILSNFNPLIELPWVTPAPFAAYISGGWLLFIMTVLIIVSQILLYYPFFKMGDRKAYEAEQQAASQQ